MTARDPLRTGALSALREGRITLLHARTGDGASDPHEIVARVRGHHGTYAVDLRDGTWSCTCRNGQQDQTCAHVLAVQLTTGHASAPPAVSA